MKHIALIAGNHRADDAADKTGNRESLASIGLIGLHKADRTEHNTGNREEEAIRSKAWNKRNNETDDAEN